MSINSPFDYVELKARLLRIEAQYTNTKAKLSYFRQAMSIFTAEPAYVAWGKAFIFEFITDIDKADCFISLSDENKEIVLKTVIFLVMFNINQAYGVTNLLDFSEKSPVFGRCVLFTALINLLQWVEMSVSESELILYGLNQLSFYFELKKDSLTISQSIDVFKQLEDALIQYMQTQKDYLISLQTKNEIFLEIVYQPTQPAMQ
jgi:hypothetical protein